MEDSHFFITLPSNSSMGVYPGNTISNYITKLSRAVNLNGEWEVGLSEIQFEKSWFNVRKRENWVYFRPSPRAAYLAGEISTGYYPDVETLIEAIHQTLQKMDTGALQNVKLTFNKVSNRVGIEVSGDVTIAFSNDIAVVLGFESGFAPISKTMTAPLTPNIQLGIYSLFVYCNIAQPQMVGDSQVPLLRIVPIEGRYGDYITRSFQSPQYIPVSRKSFDSIEIDIKDDTGRNISFESGKSVVTLHFRLKRSPYFN